MKIDCMRASEMRAKAVNRIVETDEFEELFEKIKRSETFEVLIERNLSEDILFALEYLGYSLEGFIHHSGGEIVDVIKISWK